MRGYAIIDLQFGSTGKGLLAGYLAKRRGPDTAVCAFGPNAGHTFVDANGNKLMHTMLPIGAISFNMKRVMIGPGAVIDVQRMYKELMHLRELGYDTFDLFIHENATVLTADHILTEEKRAGTARTGSTRKGTGAALADKVMREDVTAGTQLKGTPLEGYVVSVAEYNDQMDRASQIQIEGAQGFSLSHHHGFYPYVTSRDCTIMQLLSDCAVPLNVPLKRKYEGLHGRVEIQVYGVCRTFPIRVNDRGFSSGPCYSDQHEIRWEDVGVEPELTTVTKLPRRVFTFSQEQIEQAIRMNAVDRVFLNFCNYLKGAEYRLFMDNIRSAGSIVGWTGWGPSETDIRVES